MRLAIIVPRYGADVVGGAETLARGLAETAAHRGWKVEAWTTRASDHYTWKNTLAPGATTVNGVIIRRFAVDEWDPQRRAALEHKLAIQQTLSSAEQHEWMRCGPTSSALYAHAAARVEDFDLFLSLPYLMPVSYYGAWVAPEKTIVLPCLHDEPYAYLEPIRLLLESVYGVLFNTPEEAMLATQRLRFRLPRYDVLGIGVTAAAREGTPTVMSNLLYLGRLEAGTNVPLLYEYVQRYADEGGDIQLLVAGRGPIEPPAHPAFTHLGYVSEAEKAQVCASALALCQPSRNESFSFTIMESWLAKRPVLVHGNCPVTRGHVRRSKGGLWFHNYDEFIGALNWLQQNPTMSARMGQNGYRYVRRNYSWDSILTRFATIVEQWLIP